MNWSLRLRIVFMFATLGAMVSLYQVTQPAVTRNVAGPNPATSKADKPSSYLYGPAGDYGSPLSGSVYHPYRSQSSQPTSVTLILELLIFNAIRPAEAVDALKQLPDAQTRIESINWILKNSLSRIQQQDSTDEEAKNATKAFSEAMPGLFEILKRDSEALKVIVTNSQYETSRKAIDSLVEIAQFHFATGDLDSGYSVTKTARAEALRFVSLMSREFPPDNSPAQTAMTRSNASTTNSEATEYLQTNVNVTPESRGHVKLTLMWPILMAVIGFVLTTTSKPIFEAIGKAVIGKALADRLRTGAKTNVGSFWRIN